MAETGPDWLEPGHLVECLRALGYKASYTADDDGIVAFEAAGYGCHVVPYPPTDLQLAVGFLKQGAAFDLATVNDLNLVHRFAKVVVDPDGDLLVLMDLSVAHMDSAAAEKLLGACIGTWEDIVTDMAASLAGEDLPEE